MKEKYIKLFGNLFMVGILLGTLLVALFNYKDSYLLTYCMSIPVVIAPFILDKMIFKLSDFDKFVYYSFAFFAYFLGSVVSLYNLTWWYDLLMHFISGFVIGYAGILLLDSFGMYQSDNRMFNFIYCLFFAIGVAGLWEIVEFLPDILIGTNLQHNLETGVVDTMQDIICGTTSGIIFAFVIALKGKPKGKMRKS